MLNIAGPEFDLGNVVYVVLEECEHRRRGFEDSIDAQARKLALARLAKIKAAYDEFGGAPAYWAAIETEVLETAMPQYIAAAEEMNALERTRYGIWRGADPLARFVFALSGLTIGGIIIALPFIPIVESVFAFALAGLGFVYPEVKRWTHERRHVKALNRIVNDAVRYQQNARLHYMTTNDIRESFVPASSPHSERGRLGDGSDNTPNSERGRSGGGSDNTPNSERGRSGGGSEESTEQTSQNTPQDPQ